MLRRIITGGRPGAERAALEAGQALGLECRGWVVGAESLDPATLALGLQMLPATDPRQADDANILDGDALLLITYGELQEHGETLRQSAIRHERPWLHADLLHRSKFDYALNIRNWIVERGIADLTVSGSSSLEHPAIVAASKDLITSFFYLLQIGWKPDDDLDASSRQAENLPTTVNEAVARLLEAMPLKDRALLANLSAGELSSINPSLGDYILRRFELAQGNTALLASCRFVAGSNLESMAPEAAVDVIVRALWDELRRTHRLRLIK